MLFRSRASRYFAVGLSAAAFVGVAASAAEAQQVNKKQIVFGQLQYVPNSHPLIQVNNTKKGVLAYMQRPITAWGPGGKNMCLLCVQVPSVQNGLAKIVKRPDGSEAMEVTLKLRPDVNWGDGKPVSAQDIAFTWKVATEGKVGLSNYNTWDRADKVDIIDAKTVKLHLPKFDQGYGSWDQVLPSHLEAPIYDKVANTEEYVKQTLYNREPLNPGLWNGAFVPTTLNYGTQVVLEVNKHWPIKPKLDKIILTYRDNASALQQNILAGDIDLVNVSPGGISFAQMLALRKDHGTRFAFPTAPNDNLERIAFQLDNPILKDVRVRKAIAHAIDREAISERLFQGLQPVATNFVSPSASHAIKDVVQYPHDPKKASALLTQAGWKPGAGGICTNAKGEKLAFELITTAGNQTRAQIAQVIQNQLKAVCIEMSIKALPIGIYNGDEQRKRQFTGISMSSINFPPSTSPRILMGSDAIPNEGNGFTGNNFSGFANKAMDAAVAEAESLDDKTSDAGWAKIQKIAAEELPILPLYFYVAAWVAPKDMKGYDHTSPDNVAHWAENWYRE